MTTDTLHGTDIGSTRQSAKDGAACRSCAGSCRLVLDLGDQPILNRYDEAPGAERPHYRFALVACERCGLLQQATPPPASAVLESGATVTYREPKEHLGRVAEALIAAIRPAPGAAIRGVSEHDERLVALLRGQDDADLLYDLKRLTGASTPLVTAALQQLLTEGDIGSLVAAEGSADVLVARSLIEHAHDLPGLLASLRSMIGEGGHLVVEVPDCDRLLTTADPSLLWEEHIVYFTEATLQTVLRQNGFDPVLSLRIDEVGELVCLARTASAPPAAEDPTPDLKLAAELADRLAELAGRWRAFLESHRAAGRPAAFFGAGHSGAMLLNALEIGDLFEVAVDDSPVKRGRLLPGADLPIVASDVLLAGDVGLCVLCVSGELEERIAAEHAAFTDAGGVFASTSPSSPRYALADPVIIEPLDIVRLDRADLAALADLAQRTTRGRARICAHGDPRDDLHEMLIVLDRSTYVRPHRHLGRSESFHVVEGEADIVLFDDDGGVTGVLRMGPYLSGRMFYYRMNRPTFHMVIVRSDRFIVHETTTGPFDPRRSENASWAPAEEDLPARAEYLQDIERRLERA